MKGQSRKQGRKRGSYLVEAVVTLPICILALVALALVVRMIAVCETVGFVTASELKKAAASQNILNSVSLCREIELHAKEECGALTDFEVKDLDYLYRAANIDDLIGLKNEACFRVDNPAGIRGEIIFTLRLAARGFTGTRQDASPLEAEGFVQGGQSVTVLVFPAYGERFHRQTCTIVARETDNSNEGLAMDREDARRKGYTPCGICGGG